METFAGTAQWRWADCRVAYVVCRYEFGFVETKFQEDLWTELMIAPLVNNS